MSRGINETLVLAEQKTLLNSNSFTEIYICVCAEAGHIYRNFICGNTHYWCKPYTQIVLCLSLKLALFIIK